MFNNSFNGYKPNNFNSAPRTFNNVAGINKTPNSVMGINKSPNTVGGMQKMPPKENKFDNVPREKPSLAKQVMNANGENIIHNEMRGIKH